MSPEELKVFKEIKWLGGGVGQQRAHYTAKKVTRFSTGNRIDTVLLQYRTSNVEQWPIQ